MLKKISKIVLFLIFLSGILLPLRIILAPQVSKEEIARRKIEEERKQAEYKKKIEEERIYLLGHFDPKDKKEFVLVPLEYTTNKNKMYLRKETYDAFLQMRKAALKDKINLKITSATRNFYSQKNLWENKWNGIKLVEGKNLLQSVPNELERFKKILEYSSAPNTSRHHWGTDIDLNIAEPKYFDTTKGAKEYDWLSKNASLFGFCQPYNAKGFDRKNGYNEEKWHWSYIPVARQLTKDYKIIVKEEDIKGFMGDTYVPQFDLINNYVLSINPECL